MQIFTIISLLVVALISIAYGYTSPKISSQKTTTKSSDVAINRSTFLATTSAACLTFLAPPSANALGKKKEVDPALKGTKQDPEYQGCLSQCLYDCTKPKGMEQRSRAECIPECKSKCATTKEQLMKGTPIAKE